MNEKNSSPNNEEFRDHLATVTEEGKEFGFIPKNQKANFTDLE